jgi:CheY-like chemotaxis protein
MDDRIHLPQLPGGVGRHFAGFQHLMSRRVQKILLVSSLYDSYILEEDGRLSDLLSCEYLELNLSQPPVMDRVSSAGHALKRIASQKYDLVITASRLGDMDPASFSREVKALDPHLTIMLLAYHLRELTRMQDRRSLGNFSGIFLWTGDVRILLAMIKLAEDRMNVDNDTGRGEVRVILLVEDSVRFYSSFLPLIYTEVMKQTQSLMEEGVNMSHKLLRMRARPKILLANTFEEGVELFSRYRNYLLGVISDARFPLGGVKEEAAGLTFLRLIKQADPGLACVLQTSNLELADQAHRLGVSFINKGSPHLLFELRRFLLSHLGFGDFVFRTPDGHEVGRAADLRSMVDALRIISEESLQYHASRNHFSHWLRARTEFTLASMIRPVGISEFETIDELRNYLISTFSEHRELIQRGVIAEFSRLNFDESFTCVRIGGGSLGGKARGLAFINALLAEYEVRRKFEGVRVEVPPMAVIGTDIFDEFMARNRLYGIALGSVKDEEIATAFLHAAMPPGISDDLRVFLEHVDYPLAVRSSSLLEDSQYQPFAGIYSTYMISNNHQDLEVRLDQLCAAIKLVYASTYFKSAKAYLRVTGSRTEEEKMAVVLQKVVGQCFGQRAYPSFAGVAHSHNFYPVTGMLAEDGVALVALGLGKMVVEGGNCLRFSPDQPRILPQFCSTDDVLENSQRDFFALDMGHPGRMPGLDPDTGILRLELDAARQDGPLAHVGSVYSPENDSISDGVHRPGVPLVTFAHVLKTGIFPLPEILSYLLRLGMKGMGCHVELEFAVDMDTPPGEPRHFGFLQIRPMASARENDALDLEQLPKEQLVCSTSTALGTGIYEDVEDIVYVRPDTFDAAQTVAIAAEVGLINFQLKDQGRSYLLIGPGRWGTADPWLGIPVDWDQISEARVIVEAELKNFRVKPSQGTHFFQNLTALQIGYLTIRRRQPHHFIDWAWLDSLPAAAESRFLRHVRLDSALVIRIDGRTAQGAVFKPGE